MSEFTITINHLGKRTFGRIYKKQEMVGYWELKRKEETLPELDGLIWKDSNVLKDNEEVKIWEADLSHEKFIELINKYKAEFQLRKDITKEEVLAPN